MKYKILAPFMSDLLELYRLLWTFTPYDVLEIRQENKSAFIYAVYPGAIGDVLVNLQSTCNKIGNNIFSRSNIKVSNY